MSPYEEGLHAGYDDAEAARRQLGHVPPPADTTRLLHQIPGPKFSADANAMLRLTAQTHGPTLVPLVPEWLLDPQWAAGWRDGATEAYTQDQLAAHIAAVRIPAQGHI